MTDKILLIRMAEAGDVLSVGLPAVRYFKTKFPNADISVLTYGDCAGFFTIAEPSVSLITLPQDEWPENIINAIETFLGLAEKIIGQGFSRIVNLDTAFMPCFLARFLKDAGEAVEGNLISLSFDELIGGIQQETLSPELVTNPEMYINSTWFGFSQWYSRWWESDNLPERGYCEYYLARCCGYSDITMDMSLPYKEKADKKPYLAVYLGHEARNIIDTASFLSLLDENHIAYELLGDSDPIERSLSIVGNAELLVTTASAFQWYAVATNTPTLLISGHFDPRLTMPNFATTLNEKVDANVLVNDICELLEKAK